MKSRWIYLSYPLHPEALAYGGGHAFKVEHDKRMVSGDSCNTSKWVLSNHMGTHIDFPRHFSKTGQDLDDYDPGFFVFGRIHIADISLAKPGLIIGPDELDGLHVPQNTELLLIKTGFEQYRGKQVYWQENPGFHPDMAEYLRKTFPMLRIMGFDCISLSSFANRELGRQAHKAFLDNDRPILPLEDMNLGRIGNGSKINQVIVAPMHVQGTDGAPCTIFAEFV